MSDVELIKLAQLSDAEIARIDQGHRLLTAYHALNINEKTRRIGSRLLFDARPWTVQNLSEAIGFSRSSISAALADLQSCGIAQRQFEGWVFTTMGLAIAITIYRECNEIREGRFDGFSNYLTRILSDLEMGGMRRPFHIPEGSIFIS